MWGVLSMIHLSCGGQVVYKGDESVWYCQRCGKAFATLEDLATDNQVSEKSEED